MENREEIFHNAIESISKFDAFILETGRRDLINNPGSQIAEQHRFGSFSLL